MRASVRTIFMIAMGLLSNDASEEPRMQINDTSTRPAEFWHQYYDLDAILHRDWNTLGPKLQGKIHLYVGSEDTYFLNDAIYLMEDFLKETGADVTSWKY